MIADRVMSNTLAATLPAMPVATGGEGDPWAVEAQPDHYMAFFEPWDSGEHDM